MAGDWDLGVTLQSVHSIVLGPEGRRRVWGVWSVGQVFLAVVFVVLASAFYSFYFIFLYSTLLTLCCKMCVSSRPV